MMALENRETGEVYTDADIERMRGELERRLQIDLADMTPTSVVANWLSKTGGKEA